MTNAEISIIIAREDDGWLPEEALLALAEKIINTARLDLNLSVPKPVELSLVFAGDAMVKTLNAQWRGKDKPTNVLSFPSFVMKPGQQLPTMLGDIVLARETVCREAEAEGKSMENHVAHLLLHGFLHLLGYDHENEAEALEMESIETRILGQLAIPDPYAVIAYPS